MTKVKICGITNIADAEAAIEYGADALGFVFADSPRQITIENTAEIVAIVPPFICTVGVFVSSQVKEIRGVLSNCRLSAVQIHGSFDKESLGEISVSVIGTFSVRDLSVLDAIQSDGSTTFLLDTFDPEKAGGTGTTFDWDIARKAKQFGRVILAGGLTPDNIEEALTRALPYAVDVSSGIECEPGKKDHMKMKAFIEEVKSWDSRRK